MSEERDGMTNKETFDTLVEIKVSLATLTQQVKQLTDMKETIETTRKTANDADARSIENEKDIAEFQKKLDLKADEKDIKRITDEKVNWKKNLPAWVAIAISAVALLLPYLN
jgi:soluble cytochrome b562